MSTCMLQFRCNWSWKYKSSYKQIITNNKWTWDAHKFLSILPSTTKKSLRGSVHSARLITSNIYIYITLSLIYLLKPTSSSLQFYLYLYQIWSVSWWSATSLGDHQLSLSNQLAMWINGNCGLYIVKMCTVALPINEWWNFSILFSSKVYY